ncbi:hypothetical protein E2C01_036923 [Portunus trituberculatus]|uniref:Uncharacterized protein n=1 Tax=Portunus trituberculatus TaxID=210409 RepID=A0A5B7F6S0_PORTR|nr:hypothetical protein [Portunus trituberculatus]
MTGTDVCSIDRITAPFCFPRTQHTVTLHSAKATRGTGCGDSASQRHSLPGVVMDHLEAVREAAHHTLSFRWQFHDPKVKMQDRWG